jgi:hypothetical protein
LPAVAVAELEQQAAVVPVGIGNLLLEVWLKTKPIPSLLAQVAPELQRILDKDQTALTLYLVRLQPHGAAAAVLITTAVQVTARLVVQVAAALVIVAHLTVMAAVEIHHQRLLHRVIQAVVPQAAVQAVQAAVVLEQQALLVQDNLDNLEEQVLHRQLQVPQ